MFIYRQYEKKGIHFQCPICDKDGFYGGRQKFSEGYYYIIVHRNTDHTRVCIAINHDDRNFVLSKIRERSDRIAQGRIDHQEISDPELRYLVAICKERERDLFSDISCILENGGAIDDEYVY